MNNREQEKWKNSEKVKIQRQIPKAEKGVRRMWKITKKDNLTLASVSEMG